LVFLVAFHKEAETHDGVLADIRVVLVVGAAVEHGFDSAERADLVLDFAVFPNEGAEDEDGEFFEVAPFKFGRLVLGLVDIGAG
jgi:hypothetical protein